MTNETKHTPTPWRIEDGTTLIWGDCNPNDNTSSGMGYPITECRVTPVSASSWCKAPYNDEGKANAAHIVKCVNLHDELVEVLKDIQDFLKRSGYDTTMVKETLKKAGAL